MAKLGDVEESLEKAHLLDEIRSLSACGELAQSAVRRLLDPSLSVTEALGIVAEVRMGLVKSLGIVLETPQFHCVLAREPLTEAMYVLPALLAEDHHRFVEHIAAKRTVRGLPYTGLLLAGERGMGKSEYVYYLAHVARQYCLVVQADIPMITKHRNPPLALAQLYSDLEALAQKEGKVIVVLFDEFEGMVRQFTKSEHTVTSHTSHAGIKGGGVDHHGESHSFEFDRDGEAVMTQLKTLLSGTSSRTGVFTVATTNQTQFPPSLTREGRLRSIIFDQVILSKKRGFGKIDVVPSQYEKFFSTIFPLLQAGYVRECGTASAVIASGEAEWSGLVRSALSEIDCVLTQQEKKLSDRVAHEKVNTVWAKALYRFLFPNEPLNVEFANGLSFGLDSVPQGEWTNAAIGAFFLKDRRIFTDDEHFKRFLLTTFVPFAADWPRKISAIAARHAEQVARSEALFGRNPMARAPRGEKQEKE